MVDRGLTVDEAVAAARVHFEDGVVDAEPGIDEAQLEATGQEIVRFRAPSLFFGGVQAVLRESDGECGGRATRAAGVAVRASDVAAGT